MIFDFDLCYQKVFTYYQVLVKQLFPIDATCFIKVTITKINRKGGDYENSELTSCLGFMLYRILSALFSESFRDSMIASRSLEALFFSSRTRSIRVLPRGFMSFKISAVIISRPLLSCVAIQFWFSWHGPG